MNDKKKTQNAFLEAISVMIDKKIKNLGFNYYVDGVIKNKNDNNTYNVLINNVTYSNIPSKNNFEYLVGDTVQVLVKNGNWNKKIIDDKVGHDKVPQNLLNLGTRIRIYGNTSFNNYKTVGSYAVYSNDDAQTISNMPYQMAGVLDVYLSNGDKIYNDNSYIYLIQEYTILNGTKRYYRHISKSGNNADWIYGEWFEILTTSITQDYIVEQGTDGIWTYRKWNSGIVECFGCYNLSNDLPLSHTNNPLYWSDAQTTYFPDNLFQNIISCQISCESSPNIRWATISHYVNSYISWHLASTYTQTVKTGTKVTFDVKGKWK